MSFFHNAVATTYPALNLYRKLKNIAGFKKEARLRVLLYHDIASEDQVAFERQLNWLSQRWSFISPDYFTEVLNGETAIQKDSLLLTFDDGFASNRKVVEEVLNPMGIKALFFIISDFVDIEDYEESRQFIVKHIYPGKSLDNLPKQLKNMSWEDIEALLDHGHTIGAHTKSHARLSEIKTSCGLFDEIVSSADRLENQLGISIEHFAYTFGDYASLSSQALNVAKQRFRYIYSGLRGDNADMTSTFAIRRDALKPTDPNKLLGFFLEGGADLLYKRSRKILDQWAGDFLPVTSPISDGLRLSS